MVLCRDCTRRHVGCHSGCKDYAEWQAEKSAINNERCRQNDYRNFVVSGLSDNKDRRVKAKRRGFHHWR